MSRPRVFQPIDEYVPIDEGRQLVDSNIKLEKEETVDPNLGAEAYGPDNDDDINDA